ncbi:MAG: VCBS domain-containing protein [Oscillospiraceae bacterium]|nr:VCBS domain-containing protein [Oscillospiraceae bacterium]
MTETAGTTPGMQYDTNPHTVEVTVTKDDATNALSAAITDGLDDGTNVVVTNTFTPTNIRIPVKKIVNGNTPNTEEEFTFTLAKVGDAPMPSSNTTVTIKANQIGQFGQIEFNATGTYTYTVTETAGTTPGMVYVTDPQTVVITVTETADHALSAAITSGLDDGTNVVITNTFNPTSIQIPVKKIVDGDTSDPDELFTFTLAAVSAKTPEDTAITPIPMPTNAGGTTVSITAGETGYFGEISFDQPGTYTYTVTETEGTTPGMQYDTNPHTVEVTVTKDDATNALSAEITGGVNNSGSVEVTNPFTPTQIPVNVKKILTGPVPDGTDKTFTFTITGDSSTEADGTTPLYPITLTDGTVLEMPVPDETSVDITVIGDGNGPVNNTGTFGSISFNRVGIYTYTIEETVPDDEADRIPGVTYGSDTPNDPDVTLTHTLVVTVSANADNELQTSCELDDNAFYPTEDDVYVEFDNSYLPEPVQIPVNVKKILTGPVPDGTTFDFDFTITGDSAVRPADLGGEDITPIPLPKKNGTETTSITISVEGDGTGPVDASDTFGSILFEEVGTYTYTIEETVPDDEADRIPGVTYGSDTPNDPDVTLTHTLVVTVTDNNGVLETSCKLDGSDFDPTEDDVYVEFDNSYLPTPIDVPLNVKKIMTGNELPEGSEYEFIFTISSESAYRLDGTTPITPAPMPKIGDNAVTSVSIFVDSESDPDTLTAAFGSIHFTEVGIYTYTVTETMRDQYTGMTCAEDTKTVVIKIKDVNSELEIDEITGVTEDNNVYVVEITNDYTPIPVDVPLSVKKIMLGANLPKKTTFKFTFTITAVTENAPMPMKDGAENVSITIEANGNSDLDNLTEIFGDIHFTAAGTYVYTVNETLEDNYPGVRIVEGTVTVTIKIKDNNGVLEIEEITGATSNGTSYVVMITNAYSDTPGTGDDTTAAPYYAAMGGSGLLLAILAYLESKRRKAKKEAQERQEENPA